MRILTGHPVDTAGAYTRQHDGQPSVDRAIVSTIHLGVETMVFRLLTDRQADVLRQLCTGLTEEEIAEALGIRPSTVKLHQQHIRQRLGVRTVSDLCRMVQEGLTPPTLLRRAVTPRSPDNK
jgi:DNA-binding NarL/FixJ family response regulator